MYFFIMELSKLLAWSRFDVYERIVEINLRILLYTKVNYFKTNNLVLLQQGGYHEIWNTKDVIET